MEAQHRRLRRLLVNLIEPPIPGVFRDLTNPLERYDAEQIRLRYRFRPHVIHQITNMLAPLIDRATARNRSLPSVYVVLVSLQFLATGTFQLVISDTVQIHRTTACRAILQFCVSLGTFCGQFVHFPNGLSAIATKEAFAAVAGFPNVLGIVDGTQVKILKPSNDEVVYVCRKGYHSINVQIVCNADYCITSFNARYPGSVHDSTVFQESNLCLDFENGHYNDGLLLGDSGYRLRRYVMTPYLNPANGGQRTYNNSLKRTRVIVEQTIGILKRRFNILHSEIRMTPQRASTVIQACIILHNIARIAHEAWEDLPNLPQYDHVEADHDEQDADNVQLPAVDGVVTRDHLADNVFAHI